MKIEDYKPSKAGELVKNLEGNWCFVPDPLPGKLRIDEELLYRHGNAERAIGGLAKEISKLPNPDLFNIPFLTREADFSSRIEGTTASIQEVLLFEGNEKEEERKPDVREVYNNRRALEYGLKQIEHRPMSLGLIREMHEILLKDVRGKDKKPGEFRTRQVMIGRTKRIDDARYVPVPGHMVLSSMEELERFIGVKSRLPDLIRIGMVHYQFEAIHPFEDGNGRIGRAILLLMLCGWKLIPWPIMNLSVYFEKNRGEYCDLLLKVSMEGDWNSWVLFFLEGIESESNDAIQRIEKLVSLQKKYREIGSLNWSIVMTQLIDLLFSDPVVDSASVAEKLKISKSTSIQYLNMLEGVGILVEVTGQKRNRIFKAKEILDILESD